MTPRWFVRSDTFCFVAGVAAELRFSGRDTIHQFHQGLPDGELVAALLKSATGPPTKKAAQPASERSLPSKESPYFEVAETVAKATEDLDLSRTITTSDLSRRLGECRLEAKANNGQYSQDTGHKLFGSTKYVQFFSSPFLLTPHRLDPPVLVQRVDAVGCLWRAPGRNLYVLDRGAFP
jgi:hypothetical protein